MFKLFFRSILISSCAIGLASASHAAEDLKDQIAKDYGHLEKLYIHLHQNPELSFYETETAKRLAAELADLDFDVTEQVGETGIVGVMKNGDGPTILIRTDLDALPVPEQTGLPYASTVTATGVDGTTSPVMHACGHDVHMTVWTGVARQMAAMKDKWSGTLVMIGQPAEERGAGARAMLKDGLFERFPKPDYNLALHVNSALPAGKIAYSKGYALANVDSVDITVQGIGGHGAYPNTTKDPVVLASQIVVALQTLVSREVSPLEPAVVTVGSFHGGAKHNIISNEVKLQLTVRSYSDEVRQQLLDGIKRIARGQAISAGLSEDKYPIVTLRNEGTPSTFNTPELVDTVLPAIANAIGSENLVEVDPVMGGEDFSEYGRTEDKIPSFIFWLGAVNNQTYAQLMKEGKTLPSLHSPFFAPDPKPTITTGVNAMTQAAIHLFNTK
ncbi:MAG: amidohydrolase [Sphingomonadales bacterium]|jgi:hippurate hydrolase